MDALGALGTICRSGAQVVKPARPGERAEVELAPVDVSFARFPIAISGFPSYVFGFQKCPDVGVLAASLAEVLSTWRIFAGRFRPDGKAIVLCDSGVPLTVRRAPDMEHTDALWRCSDFREPRRVASGAEPVLTVTLTKFASGAGVVAICRSHGAADGSSFTEFVDDWAGAIAGRACAPIKFDRPFNEAASEAEALAMAEKSLGYPARVNKRKRQARDAMNAVAGKAEICMLACGRKLSDRPCMFFSHAELAALKRRASAQLRKVPWITTQEAFIAHMLQVIPRYFGKGPRVGLLLLLDGKRQIGLERQCTGTAMLCLALVFDVGGKTLGDLAEDLQMRMGAFKGDAGVEELRKCQETARHDVDMPLGPPNLEKLQGCDHRILLNNQSKISLPDFGTGPAEWANSSSGPSLMLPHRDGIRIFFDGGSLPASPAQLPEVEALLHLVDGA